jgi:hypothetical protein
MILPALVQFASPHAFLSTATGLAFSARALGGAFGSAILNTIINGELSRSYALFPVFLKLSHLVKGLKPYQVSVSAS